VNDTLHLWVLIIALTILLNAIPAFMPPTWALLTYFHIHQGMDIWMLAVVGGIASATGRTILSVAFRTMGTRILPVRWRTNIEALGQQMQKRQKLSLSALALFFLGPVPSNQVFIALGIARVRLAPAIAVFAVTRGAGYAFWIMSATSVASSLSEVLRPGLGSAASVIAQVVGLGILFAVMQVDWPRIVQERLKQSHSMPEGPACRD
jgi:membrane protein YqaA with SNARE-associated domain